MMFEIAFTNYVIKENTCTTFEKQKRSEKYDRELWISSKLRFECFCKALDSFLTYRFQRLVA